MNYLHRTDAAFDEMRAARLREERFTLIFLAAATGVAGLIAALALGIVFAVWPVEAFAHDARPTAARPQGWSYPFSCCSGYDCREVGDSRSGQRITVAEIPEGYRISATGEVLAYGDTRIRNSPDGEFHWCSVAGADDSRTICLFVPPRGF